MMAFTNRFCLYSSFCQVLSKMDLLLGKYLKAKNTELELASRSIRGAPRISQ